MFLQRSSRALRWQWRTCHAVSRRADPTTHSAALYMSRGFRSTARMQVVKPVLLADIGEGIVECEVIQWFVEPEARVEEFSPLCEVQSDKASVEITSRFSGVVKKLYYEAGEMAKVGKPFVDIDIQGDVKKEDLDALTGDAPAPAEASSSGAVPEKQAQSTDAVAEQTPTEPAPTESSSSSGPTPPPSSKPKGKSAHLATPAVRHLLKQHEIDIAVVDGTGKDGRVLKEDIYKFLEEGSSSSSNQAPSAASSSSSRAPPASTTEQVETPVALTNIQTQMFKAMTRSLTIPHFLYTDEVDFSSLHELRRRLNKVLATSALGENEVSKLSYLPFVIKAVSLALFKYPILNARVDVGGSDPSSSSKPTLVHRSQHNIGVAMDTPSGLLVPVIKDVASLNVLSIAAELVRLQAKAAAGKLSPADLTGGTITVSNIGNIGGTYLSPVIVDKEVAILGMGRMRTVPAFDEHDNVVKKQVCNFSWSADHRIVDGATMARAADVVRQAVEEPDVMIMHLR
ncbi:2-oxoacid dehydrogenases acyltransferase-domain-containing protein [Microdochium trichocladiopsis]|uniref:Dihydrolipoamide acetyltransferase component of pyruvate dehydrogenase complex n=1 Tax=Microdochium trichocladiopsis TaxID=1682393 RepID=A0A9P8YE68_9PEZI|nr:2-oxoacid dehydrogenases acyltransferase-domain-containing protein [Microdochium trichocladiopsis]KAH7035307.1 2-oxoacid dehydrogenases acyltransferase-domain-containing protein [Microdochium trichocladiopsis]